MAIAFDASATDTTPATTTAINPGAAAGAYILDGAVSDSTLTTLSSWPAGFSTIAGPQTNTADNQTAFLGRKISASGSEGSLTTTFSENVIGAMMSFTGVDGTTPEDVTFVVANQNTAANPRTLTANITPVTDGAMIVAAAYADAQSGVVVTFTFSTTAGTTGAWSKPVEINNGFYNMAFAYAPQTTAGAITVQVSGAASANMGITLFVGALRPSGGPQNQIFYITA